MNVVASSGPAPITVIAAMHAQYELADRRYVAAETAQASHKIKSQRFTELGWAQQDIQREMDSLRNAILRQRIVSNRDLAIFACHLHWLSDMIEASDLGDEVKEPMQLLNVATETLFDYVVGEGFADMEDVGDTFRSAAMRCHERRNDRDGTPADAEVSA